MKTFLLLACILSTLHLFCSSEDTLHPIYSFRCLESTGVELYGVHPGSTIQVEKKPKNCTAPTQNANTSIFLINYNCLNATDSGFAVKISVTDSVLDKHIRRKRSVNTTTSAPPQPSSIATSTTTHFPVPTPPLYHEHKFIIRCQKLPVDGVNKVVAHVFKEKTYNELPVQEKEVYTVEMQFKAVLNIDAPDINSIYVGDEFYMFIKYRGESNYVLRPQKCAAYKGTSVPVDSTAGSVVLWSLNENRNNCSTHPDLMKEIQKNDTNKVIYAKMYGFRFVDSEYITILCEVKVYRHDKTPEICPNTTSRRKRDLTRPRRDIVGTPFETKKIMGKLIVNDLSNESANTGSKIRDSGAWMGISLIILIAFPRCFPIFL